MIRSSIGAVVFGRPPRFICLLALSAWVGLGSTPLCVQAQEGLFLTWNDCPLSILASHDLATTCGGDEGRQDLYCTFRLPQPLDSVIAVEVVVDIQHASAELPDWWQFAEGGCREGSLIFSSQKPPNAACEDFWMEMATEPDRPSYLVMEPRGASNQARIRFGVALPSDQAQSLNATDLYYAARLELRNALTLGCSGCPAPACLVLNSILIGRLPGAAGGDYLLTVPGPNEANWATWQGSGADCGAVPVRSTTWGRVKSFYR